MSVSLDPVIAGLRDDWHGAAADAFQRTSAHFDPTVADYVAHLNDAAGSLETVAAAIEEAQVQTHNFMIMLGILVGSGLVLTFLSFGLSDVVAAGEAEADAGIVATFMARVDALFGWEAEALAALRSAATSTITRMALGMGFATITTVGVKAWGGQDPLDPANYSAEDASNIALGGVVTPAIGMLGTIGPVGAMLEAHPFVGAFAAGTVAGGLGSAIEQFWFNDAPSDADTWENILGSAAIGAVAGVATAGLYLGGRAGYNKLFGGTGPGVEEPLGELSGTPAPALGAPLAEPATKPLFPAEAFPRPGYKAVSLGDFIRPSTGVPAGAIQYLRTIPQNVQVNGPDAPPSAPAVDSPPPSAVVVRNESLWTIAKRVYGDGSKYKLIAAANHIADPDRVYSEEELILPPDPDRGAAPGH